MGSGWENPDPATSVIIDGSNGELFVYDTLAGIRRLILAVAGSAGNTPDGFHYEKGLSIVSDPLGTDDQEIVFVSGPTVEAFVKWVTGTSELLVGSNQNLRLAAVNQVLIAGPNVAITDFANPVTVQIGTGYAGMNSDADGTWGRSIPGTGAVTQIVAIAFDKQKTDYAGEWAGATFTAKVEGFYDTTLFCSNNLPVATNLRTVIRKNGINIAGNPGINSCDASCSYNGLYMQIGDQLTYFIRQDSGGAVAMTGRISVHRRPI